jgi:diguanylate cyclase (GGDEF)-like protein/PAS domain S-box-containing protein
MNRDERQQMLRERYHRFEAALIDFFTGARTWLQRHSPSWLQKQRTALSGQHASVEPSPIERALRESEERYRIVAETATDAIVTIDHRSVILFVNRATERIFGYGAQELVGQQLTMLIPERMRSVHLAALQRFLDQEEKHTDWQNVELHGLHRDGHEISLEVSFGKFQEGGKHLFTGILRDITERKRADTLRNGEARVLEMIATGAPLSDTLTELMRLTESQADGMFCSVLLLDEDGQHLRNGASPSLPEGYIKLVEGIAIGPQVGSCGTAAYRGETVIVNDILTDPLWTNYRDVAAQYNLRACWSTPIFSRQGKVLGTFAMYYRDVRSPGDHERYLLDIATHLAGIAIERDRAEERVRHMAQHDALTGLPNRLLFRDRVNQSISQAQRTRQQVAVMFIDLDHFKDINDSLGHQVGDQLLRSVARRLQRCLRHGDTVARLGGDEFVVSLPALKDANEAMMIAGKVLETLRRIFVVDRHELHVTGSIGVSLYPVNGEDAESLMRSADAAMYHAKEKGRDNYQFFVPRLNEAARRRLTIANRLRQALQREEFVLHYQPQINLKDGTIFSAEALLRWNQSDLGILTPTEFIKVAEETGVIVPLGEWVLQQACEQLKRWREAGHANLHVTVNLSPHQLRRPGFPEFVVGALERASLPADSLEIEITEGILMMYSPENVTALGRLARMGVRLAIDDFGTGYSSLSYLQRFPISVLKIDHSFVSGIGQDPNDTNIVGAIIAMAESLQIKVVAEGVETEEQAKFLRGRGCYAAQGHYYSRAVPADKFLQLLRKPSATLKGVVR